MIYNTFAEYYELYIDKYDYDGWFHFLCKIGGFNEPDSLRGKRVLDLGCGTGRMLRYFYRDGAIALGVDSSEDMVEMAETVNEDERSEFPEGGTLLVAISDIIDFRIHVKFDFIYAMGDTMNYLLGSSSLFTVLCNVRTMLAPNSVFTFDIINGDCFEYDVLASEDVALQKKPSAIELHFDREKRRTNEADILQTDLIIYDDKLLDTDNIDNFDSKAYLDKMTETHIQRLYTRGEIRELAEMLGFVYSEVPFFEAEGAKKKKKNELPEKYQIVLRKATK